MAYSQAYRKIESFTYHMAIAKDGECYYILKPCFMLLNNQIDCRTDSVRCLDPSINSILSIHDTIYNNWNFDISCYHFQNLTFCKKDSVQLYLPIENKIKNSRTNVYDSSNVADLSTILSSAREPVIYRSAYTNNVARLTAIYTDYVEITRFEKNNDSIIIYHNRIDYTSEEPTFTKKSVKLTDLHTYNDCMKLVNNLLNLNRDENELVCINNILVESLTDGKYQYLRINDFDLLHNSKHEYKRLLKLISKCLKPEL